MRALFPSVQARSAAEALETTDGRHLGAAKVDLVAEKVADVGHIVLDHSGPLQTQAPGNDAHVVGQPHRPQHLWSEHARVSDLGPALQVRVIAEDLHARLCVRVVGRLEAQICDANLRKEGLDHPNEVGQRQVPVCHQTLYLVELAEMGGVHAFVAEDTVDRKVLFGRELALRLVLLSHLVQHLARDRCGVRAQDVLHRLLALEVAAVADGAVAALLVHLPHPLVVILRHRVRARRLLDEEGVVGVAGGVALRLKKRVEVPEAALHPLAGGHLGEPHAHEDLPELRPHLEQRVQVATLHGGPQRLEVLRLEHRRLPGAAVEHLLGEVAHPLHAFGGPFGPRRHPERLACHLGDQLAALEVLLVLLPQPLGPQVRRLQPPQHLLRAVLHRGHQGHEPRAVLPQPAVLHAGPHAHAGRRRAHRRLHLRELGAAGGHRAEEPHLRGALRRHARRLRGEGEVGQGERLRAEHLVRLQALQLAHHGLVGQGVRGRKLPGVGDLRAVF
mmetsp:Transcript_22505/g.36015  ORF Transcript_22505/g.36015 Transcript_22505/m.36015 type:complete len:502 (+) Transcript_22505:251-1756(+)